MFDLNVAYDDVLATCHDATEVGSCRLPAESYAVSYPVALGNIDSLQDLKFQGNLCGHILRIDCGNGAINIIVSNSNLGGGLDLYRSTWNKATNGIDPGETKCSVELTSENPFTSSGYKCYHATGETNNAYYRSVGLLNTEGRITNGALLNGINGVNYGSDLYYNLQGYGTGDDQVTFYFQDGGSYAVYLRDCLSGEDKQIWS